MKTRLCCYTFVKPDREYSQGLKIHQGSREGMEGLQTPVMSHTVCRCLHDKSLQWALSSFQFSAAPFFGAVVFDLWMWISVPFKDQSLDILQMLGVAVSGLNLPHLDSVGWVGAVVSVHSTHEFEEKFGKINPKVSKGEHTFKGKCLGFWAEQIWVRWTKKKPG